MLVQEFARERLYELQPESSDTRNRLPAYTQRTFYWYNNRTGHSEELTDYVKASDDEGPERFVVAFDRKTGECFLRSELRSYENLECLDAIDRPKNNTETNSNSE